MAYSPDGQTVLTGGGGNDSTRTARLWRPVRPSVALSRLASESPKSPMWALLSPDGKTALTGGFAAGEAAQLREVSTGKPLGAPLQHGGGAGFGPDGMTILTVGYQLQKSQSELRLWEANTGKVLGKPLLTPEVVTRWAFSPDGRMLLTGSQDGPARLWEIAGWQPIGPPIKHPRLGITASAFSADGKVILTGGGDQTARLWETGTGRPLGQPLQHGAAVTAVALSRDGNTVFTGTSESTRGEGRLWEATTGKPLGSPLTDQGGIFSATFSSDGETLLTGGRTNRLRDATTGRPLGPSLPSGPAVFSLDGKNIVVLTTSRSKNIMQWDIMQWPVPSHVHSLSPRVTLWLEVMTGLELDESGAIVPLDANTWEQRRERLKEMGGPPIPTGN